MKNPGFEVKSPCGRVWFVPHSAVFDDYVAFVKQADSLSEEEARLHAQEECDIETWFCEQFNWTDVKQYGTLIKQASPEDVESALNFVLNNSGSSVTEEYRTVSQATAMKSRKTG